MSELREKVALAIARVIAKRHGDEADHWLNDSRREEADAAIVALSPPPAVGEWKKRVEYWRSEVKALLEPYGWSDSKARNLFAAAEWLLTDSIAAAPASPSPPRDGLFRFGNFTLHSGELSAWKIDCDALTDEDLATLAAMAANRIGGLVGNVEGVPTGGLRFAEALSRYSGVDRRLVIVDDVLTTGKSMEEQRAGRDAIGVVIFARGPCPAWIVPLFTVGRTSPPPHAVASYDDMALANREIDFLESRADEWMQELGVQRMFNAMASVFEKYASQDIMDRFREKLRVVGRQCFVEGAVRAWDEIAAQQRALGRPLPRDAKDALATLEQEKKG